MEKSQDEEYNELVENIGNIMNVTLNEGILIRRMENYFSPKAAKLAANKEEERHLEEKLKELTRQLGSPVGESIPLDESIHLKYDTYGPSALQEILSSFHRSRRAVCKAHLFFIGAGTLQNHPEFIPSHSKVDLVAYSTTIVNYFYEEAETAYIKLASYWDRVGQVMDYVFFNIRQYERDGFSSVMNRIKANILPLYANLENNEWNELRKYQNSENEDGFKWLLQRRNLFIHSLHLQSIEKWTNNNPIDDPIYNSAHNHLEKKFYEKLKPKEPEIELNLLHAHLEIAARLFPLVLDCCLVGAKINGKR